MRQWTDCKEIRAHTLHISCPPHVAVFRTDHTADAMLQVLICNKLFDISASIFAIYVKSETYNPSQRKPGEEGGNMGKAREN